MDRPSLLFADGLPCVLDALVLTGRTPHQAQMLRYFDTLEPVPTAPGNARPRRNALPSGRDGATFPTAWLLNIIAGVACR